MAILIVIVLTTGWVLYNFNKDEVYSYYFNTDEEKNIGFFKLHYKKGDERLVEILEKAYPKIVNQEELWFHNKIESMREANLHIYLSSDKNGENATHDERGRYWEDQKILFVNKDLNKKELVNIFSHELSHFYFIEYVKKSGIKTEQIPLWIHEGMAMSFAQKISPELIQDKTTENQPLMQIKPTKMEDGKTAYLKGEYLLMMFSVEYLIHHYGEKIITDLVEGTKNSQNFKETFEKLTGLNLNNYHKKFENNIEIIDKFDRLILKGRFVEAEDSLILYLKERGNYFNEAPLVFTYLGNLYIDQGRYKEALPILENKVEFLDVPSVYQQLSEVAEHVNKEKSILYAKEAVKSAKRNNWNVKIYEEFLSKQLAKAK